MRRLAVLALLALAAASARAVADEPLRVGSKRFTESYVLGEIVRQTAARAGVPAEHRQGLGNTGIVLAALKAGEIDLYPEYAGTIAREVLKADGELSLEALNRGLAPLGLAAAVPLGFNNTYALAVPEARAEALGIRTISDLARHPALRLGFTQEFIGRKDGWPGLRAAYRLPQEPLGIDHGLGYEALASGRIDVKDVYSTDAKIARYKLRVLDDDRRFFPRYDAVLLHRADLPARFPAAWDALRGLEGRIDAQAMIRMNAAAELEGRTFADAAGLFFGDDRSGGAGSGGTGRGIVSALFAPDLLRLTGEHLLLVAASLAAAVAVGVPLGVAAFKAPRAGRAILGAAGIVQTIPSLALLALLIAAIGRIGTVPALIALFLYALLPIVQNTHAGLATVGAGLRDAAAALGLSKRATLASVELPLAAPTILAGVQTAAVINVGTATIAAFIGAGGYGERIVQGLALNDAALLVAGALPAAALAVVAQAAFAALERRMQIRMRRG